MTSGSIVPDTPQPLIELISVSKSYREGELTHRVIDSVDVTIAAGDSRIRAVHHPSNRGSGA